MKTKIKTLALAVIAVMLTSVGCQKETTPTPIPPKPTYTVEYRLLSTTGGSFTVYYNLNGVQSQTNVQSGWKFSFTGTQGDYESIWCTPSVQGQDVNVNIFYNNKSLNSSTSSWPNMASASGTLP